MRDTVRLETLFYEFPADGVAVLTLNRPESANGVVPELVRDLCGALDDLEADTGIRALVLTGAGRQFCAGGDLKAMRRYLDEELHIAQEPYNARVLFPLTQRLTTSRLPIVAAINGGATAGGLDLALACDIRIASSRAKLGETYIRLGLVPGNGGTYFLPRLLGSGMAAELALTGDIVDAARALEIGLVTHVVEPDELRDAAVALAAKLAGRPRLAIEATKQALRASWSHDLSTAMSASFWAVSALYHTDDLREGVAAALEKREPQYNRTPGGK
ncbi:enoyl-CoA hydratase/isomerase family protein [Amycolatopsis sp.]|uniref:enoyl-CoA hydratase/isomerase family protein n=1 Tax=Amycolatopsis sp. TaxID=37632 RepID=UPI002C05B9F0|nr:enoyl-CoA hydratase/isomerase family protein [Amycolatopsis sp.]HVV08252.1 enoyl-CoA hydratase/isomerase family protein [Amycolatopsis sp.]